eukprot:2030740-Amphidinium_carterae.1
MGGACSADMLATVCCSSPSSTAAGFTIGLSQISREVWLQANFIVPDLLAGCRLHLSGPLSEVCNGKEAKSAVDI